MTETSVPTPVPTSQAIAAVIADVDGTLVTKGKVLTPRAIAAIERLYDHGVVFAITSGRPPRGMRMLVGPLELRGPMFAFNGGVMVLPDMTIVDERPVPADVAPGAIDTIRAHGVYPWIYRGADWYLTDPGAPHAEKESRTVQFQPTVVPGYDGLLDRTVKIVGASDDHEAVARCEAALQEQFGTRVTAIRSQPYYVDITNPTANKGQVVERLSGYYKIPAERIATLGDQLNDVPMFRGSGLSVAMGNASDEVQRSATFVTASNEDEGFAKAIEQFILPRAVAAPGHRAVHPAMRGPRPRKPSEP
jgi:Cof subfamily protein (haloacid dehalogenase superfamily)